MIFWYANGHLQAAINDIASSLMSMTIKELTLPGHIKKINSSGGIVECYTDILYYINQVAENSRGSMTNLTTITTEPGVYEIDFNLTATPSLEYFNLMEGLQVLKLSYNSFTRNVNGMVLKVPSSVVECELKCICFSSLIIDDGPVDLKLTYIANQITGKFICNRTLTNTSSFTMWEDSETIIFVRPPPILETNISLLKLLHSNNDLGYFDDFNIEQQNIEYNISTYTTLIFNEKDINYANIPSLPNTLKFKRIYNNTMFNYGDVSNLTTDHWIG
jgi:hypothetical protein